MGMGEISEYDCDLARMAWTLSPLAHIPGGATTVNPFHNPYPPLGCVVFSFYCRKDSFILGDLYINPRGQSELVCPGYNIVLEQRSWRMRLNTNPWVEACRTVDRWLSMDVFVYRQNEFIFMYGCRQVSENLPVTVGAWILADSNATEAQRAHILQITRKLASKIPGFRDEWWTFPMEKNQCGGNLSCAYLANCQVSLQEEQALSSESEAAQTVYMIAGPLMFVTFIILARSGWKFVHRNKIGPAQTVARAHE